MQPPMMGMGQHAMVRNTISPRPLSASIVPGHNTGAMPKMLNRQLPVQPPPSLPHNVSYMHNARNGYNRQQTPQPQQQMPPQPPMPQPAVTDNQSTPVVSLLSLGQGNERDFRSMQGGRKCRQGKPIETSGNGLQQYRVTGTPVFSIAPVNGNQPSNTNRQGRRIETIETSMNRSWSNRRRYYPATGDSNIRTNSNSSANVNYDENLNERKDRTGGEYRAMSDFVEKNKNTGNGQFQFDMPEPIPVLADSRATRRITTVQSATILGAGRRKKRNYARRTSTVVRCITPVEHQDTDDGSCDSGPGPCNNLVDNLNDRIGNLKF